MRPNLLRAAAAAALVALAACAAGGTGRVAPQQPLPSYVDDQVVRDLGRAALADAGLTPRTLEVVRMYTRTIFGEDDELRVDHYDVWARIEECAEGQAVVEVSRQGRISQIYTRYGCEAPGIPAY